MDKKKKKIIRIIRNDSNKEGYTFVKNYNILNNVNNLKDNESATTNNEKMFGDKPKDQPKERIEKKKIHSKK
jgi:hypothetical protein